MTLQKDLPLVILPDKLAICRLAAESPFPEWARPGDLQAFIRSRDELTIVCVERLVPPEITAERGWRALQVQGPLDFSLVGVLATITAPLANAGVSVFALSTYETDYILVKEETLERATHALSQAGFLVLNHVHLPA